MKGRKHLALAVALLIGSPVPGEQDAASREASYTGDLVTNFSGGLAPGTPFLGMADLKLGVQTQAAGWWKGGTFFVNRAATHGNSPSENLVGDFQIISNIDAGDHVYLQELWYLGGGVVLSGYPAGHPDKAIGLGVAQAGFHQAPAETVVELFMRRQLTPFLILQPDLQYIIKPAGTGQKVQDALAGIVRFQLAC